MRCFSSWAIIVLVGLCIVHVSRRHVTANARTTTGPQVLNDSYYTDVNTPLHIEDPGYLGNDEWGEGYTWASCGGLEFPPGFPEHGTIYFQSDQSGEFLYVPDEDFEGVDHFGYVVFDAESNSSEIATVTITVGGQR